MKILKKLSICCALLLLPFSGLCHAEESFSKEQLEVFSDPVALSAITQLVKRVDAEYNSLKTITLASAKVSPSIEDTELFYVNALATSYADQLKILIFQTYVFHLSFKTEVSLQVVAVYALNTEMFFLPQVELLTTLLEGMHEALKIEKGEGFAHTYALVQIAKEYRAFLDQYAPFQAASE